MSDIELGPGKRARAAYSFDDIAIVPSRRTRDPEEVSITWQIDAYKFDLPKPIKMGLYVLSVSTLVYNGYNYLKNS